MPSRHLLNQEGPQFPHPREIAPGVMESRSRLASEVRAKAAIGHPDRSHRRRSAPASLSGTIAGFRRVPRTSPIGRRGAQTNLTQAFTGDIATSSTESPATGSNYAS